MSDVKAGGHGKPDIWKKLMYGRALCGAAQSARLVNCTYVHILADHVSYSQVRVVA